MVDWGIELTPRAEEEVRRLDLSVQRQSDDLEYAYALKVEAEAVRRGELKTRRLDEIVAELGLDA